MSSSDRETRKMKKRIPFEASCARKKKRDVLRYKHLQSVGWRAAHLCVVGTKFDAFATYPLEDQKEVIAHAKKVGDTWLARRTLTSTKSDGILKLI